MTVRSFIRTRRAEIDAAIRKVCPNAPALNDAERHQWIINEWSLYEWARGEGVNV